MGATYGRKVRMTIFGESHGKAIGVVLDGLPPGLLLDEDAIRSEMARRAPGRNNLGTQRKEADAYELESGVFNGRTTGTPLCARIANSDQHSKDYSVLADKMRPGHADYPGRVKYHGFNDYRGGGHFSGRLTAPLVFAGAVCKQVLAQRGIQVAAHIARIGSVVDTPFHPLGEPAERLTPLREQVLPTLDPAASPRMEQEILSAKAALDSVGGCVELLVQGVPAGVGEPFFDSLESCLAHALFSVPAVKGVEFGDGFALAAMHGSESNDEMHYEGDRVTCYTNHNGGMTGGITNGMPLLLRVAVKPTPSISRPQRTVSLANGTDTTLTVTGRHDPCIVQRAVPVLEAVVAFVVLDMLESAYL